MRSSNPTLRADTFTNVQSHGTGHMTIDGTVNKTTILLLLLVFAAAFTWQTSAAAISSGVMWLYYGGIIVGLVLAIVIAFKHELAPYLAPFYALAEGVALGVISSFFEIMFPGIVIQAVGLTFGTMFAMLFIYKAKIVKVTENFKIGLMAATGGIFVVYMISFVGSFFGFNIPFIHESGLLGIGFSLFVVVIAALNLVLDFDFIEKGAHHRAPKHMEWYGAFGLLVTLVWLYIEFLRLLAKLRDR
ncbi:Bax inhibitor-1/YccA family protein [Candidatus Woesearchaeota archaeon]|nr:Bax inhibitor-1/YccA family protein [Candidatus Woesearchaeota archaeon]